MTELEKFIKAMDSEKLMKAVAEGFKSLSQAIDSLATHIEDLTRKDKGAKKPAKTARKPKATAGKAAKAKTPAAKAKAATARKTDKKKAAAKATAIDTVYGYISRARNGIDVESLVKKTGFDNKKVHNVIYKLKKQNKIKSVDRGRYQKV